jgi:hypothetical protein
MTRNSIRTVVVFAALAVCVALSAAAFAAPGDGGTVGNAVDLTPTMVARASYDASLAPDPVLTSTGCYYFRVQLSQGQILRADFTSGPDVIGLAVLVRPLSSEYPFVGSSPLSPSVARLTFTAPAPGLQWYTLQVGTSTLGTFTVQPVQMTGTKLALSGAKSVKVKKTYKVTGSVTSNAARGTVTFTAQRYASKKWKSVTASSASIGAGGKFAYSFKPSTKGNWRVFASYGGQTTPVVIYAGSSTAKPFKVK